MRKITFYGIRDPEFPVTWRYVGRTANFSHREYSHQLGSGNLLVSAWERLVRMAGRRVVVNILEELETYGKGPESSRELWRIEMGLLKELDNQYMINKESIIPRCKASGDGGEFFQWYSTTIAHRLVPATGESSERKTLWNRDELLFQIEKLEADYPQLFNIGLLGNLWDTIKY